MNITQKDLTAMVKNKRVFLPINKFLSGEYPYHIANLANVIHQSKGTLVLLDYNSPEYEIGIFGRLRAVARNNEIDSTLFYGELVRNYPSTVVTRSMAFLEGEELNEWSNISNFRDIKEINEELFHSIRSIWMSRNLITLKDRDLTGAEIGLLQSDVKIYFRTLRTIEGFLKENPVDLVAVPNGRNPDQVAIKHAAINFQTSYVHFERCFRGAGRLFFQSFQTQDTKKMNKYFAELLESYNAKELHKAKEWSKSWLLKQSGSISANPFITFISKGSERKYAIKSKGLVPIFTSSIDERFSNLGIDLNKWESQTQALVSVSKRITSLGYSTITRIHPNTGWKSWRELIELVSALRNANLRYILPWENVSSYDLLESAPLVVTWGSTLALESTARGIPTFNLGFSRFDELIDIELVSGGNISNWSPDLTIKPSQEKSLLAIYVSRNYGLKLEGQDWVDLMIPKIKINQEKSLRVKSVVMPYVNFWRALFFPLNRRPYDTYFIFKRVFGKRVSDCILQYLLSIMVMKHGFQE